MLYVRSVSGRSKNCYLTCICPCWRQQLCLLASLSSSSLPRYPHRTPKHNPSQVPRSELQINSHFTTCINAPCCKKWNITVHFMTDRLYVLRTQQKLSQLNRTRRDDFFSYLGEVLWSTDTCWHPLHRVQITGRRTCSFQCSLLNSRTSSRLQTRCQTYHIRVSRSSGRPQTSPRQPIPHSCYGCPSLGMTKILFKIRGSA